MAEAATAAPARRRATKSTTTARKPTQAVSEPTGNGAEVEAKDGNVEAITVTLEPLGDTKKYAKWGFPEGCGCVGNVYTPIGAGGVKVRIMP